MSLVTCGGVDALDGAIHLLSRGAWWARMRLDTATVPSGVVTISASGGLSLSGFVIPSSSGVAYDVAHVQVVGGAGGLAKTLTPAAYENAQLRDPLEAVLGQAGESMSSTISSSILSVQLPKWTLVASTAARALDELCGAAASALGQSITWRVLGDGSIWLGAETWPAKSMPTGSDILDIAPGDGRWIIGADSPWLLPGVNLDGVGNIGAVDHYFDSHIVRSWAWLA